MNGRAIDVSPRSKAVNRRRIRVFARKSGEAPRRKWTAVLGRYRRLTPTTSSTVGEMSSEVLRFAQASQCRRNDAACSGVNGRSAA